MSATLQTTTAPATTLLDSLSCADPTAADLRDRAVFWREYLRTTPGLTTDQIARLEASCVALLARADRMDAPAPVPVLVAPVRAKAARKSPAAPKPAAIAAERFWTMHTEAVRAIREIYGDSWHSRAPLSETVVLSVPARLCTMTGPLGGKIKWRRDWRMPAGRYWDGAALPDCGLEVAPAPVDQGPLPGAGVAEIVAEQIKQDKRYRIVAAARVRHAQALRGGLKLSAGMNRGRYPRALWWQDAAAVRRELASALFNWKVSVGLVDGAEYGVDGERDLAGEG